MSWSITFIGAPENVIKALVQQSEKMSDSSKIEYDAALPHLVGLVGQNFGSSTSPLIKISASGSGHTNNSIEYRQCQCTIESIYGTQV